jgi:hypothetical protein
LTLPITRRTACAFGAAALATPGAFAIPAKPRIEQWGLYEVALKGPATGNPFLDVSFSAVFDNGVKSIAVPGFYDGDGAYRIRFMPPAAGSWRWTTKANVAALDGKSGQFEAGAPSKDNHGPVAVANTFHFAYADGTAYRPFGTTAYAWTHQSDALCEETLKTLAASPFNKIRFAIFPNEDVNVEGQYPFAGMPKAWDFTRFNPAFFQRFEKLVVRLGKLGIEADIILFHPYDHGLFGFDSMAAEVDARYLRYVVARFAAYRHVWWSLANEYDDIKAKTEADFDTLFQVVAAADPFSHLRSIHHNRTLYDYSKPWVTHASIQNGSAVIDDGRAVLYRDVWRKPVVFDEVKYEGNMAKRWGNLSGEEMVKRCWYGTIAGTYVGHGESIEHDGKKLFLGNGGRLYGTSPQRIAFLRKILEDGPRQIEPIDKWQERHLGGEAGRYYLRYFGDETPREWAFVLPKLGLKDGDSFAVDILDTWAMTITPVAGSFTVHKKDEYDFVADRAVTLPGKPWQALRIRKI